MLAGYSGRTPAIVWVVTYDRPRRMRRALAGLGTWCAAALVSALIPVAHFVLVPSFLLYGAYVFVRRLNTEQVAVAGQGACPDCGKDQALDLAGRWSLPRDTSCRYCHRGLRMTEAESSMEG